MNKSSEEVEFAIRILSKAVKNALDKKNRLGQFAIINKSGKPVRLEATQTKNNHISDSG